jgi:hypothetical protein
LLSPAGCEFCEPLHSARLLGEGAGAVEQQARPAGEHTLRARQSEGRQTRDDLLFNIIMIIYIIYNNKCIYLFIYRQTREDFLFYDH